MRRRPSLRMVDSTLRNVPKRYAPAERNAPEAVMDLRDCANWFSTAPLKCSHHRVRKDTRRLRPANHHPQAATKSEQSS